MSTPAAPSPLASLRVTATALVTAPLVILLAVSFVLPGEGMAPLWAWGAVALAAASAALIVQAVGYRTPAIEPGTPEDEARRMSLNALTSTTILRCALTEAVAILGLALAFAVTEGGLLLYVVAAVTSVVLSILFAWPSGRIIGRVRDSLERAGGRSFLPG